MKIFFRSLPSSLTKSVSSKSGKNWSTVSSLNGFFAIGSDAQRYGSK